MEWRGADGERVIRDREGGRATLDGAADAGTIQIRGNLLGFDNV